MISKILQSKRAAYVAPLAVFLLLSTLAGWLRVENPELPWHRRAPELWVYPLQCVLCLIMLVKWRGNYRFGPWSLRGIVWAIALGIAGIALWLLPVSLNEWVGWDGGAWRWLGVRERTNGFDPRQAEDRWLALVVALRFLRMVVVVPLVEEIFWRGFLMRALIDDGKKFYETAFGAFGWRSVIVTTLLFATVHQPVDWGVAVVFGLLMAWLTIRVKSLGACVLMHAVANAILGIFVMQTQMWGLW